MTKRSLKIVSIGMGAVLAGAFLVAGFGSSWFKNGDITTWYNSWGKGNQTTVTPPDDTGDNTPPAVNIEGENVGINGTLLPSEVKGNGVRLMAAAIAEEDYSEYGISPLVDSAYTVTATVEPETATDKTISYSMQFITTDGEEEYPAYVTWANGENPANYLTISQGSAGSAEAVLTVQTAFGAPIKVTATSNSNPDVSASFVVHYIQRMESVTASIAAPNGGAGVLAIGANTSFTLIPKFGVGTVRGDYTISGKLGFSDTYFWPLIKSNSNYAKINSDGSWSGSWALKEGLESVSVPLGRNYNFTSGSFKIDISNFVTLTGGGNNKAILDPLTTAIYEVNKDFTASDSVKCGSVTFTVSYEFFDHNGNGSYTSSLTTRVSIDKLDMSAVQIPVSNISLDKTEVYI